MANYKEYRNLPPDEEIARESGAGSSLYEVFRYMIESGYTGNMAMLWNGLCNTSNFPDEETFKATVLPIACMIIKAAPVSYKRGNSFFRYYTCSPSFQAQLARLVRKYYPDVRGRTIKDEEEKEYEHAATFE